ncbi:MAG: ABC transporter permease [Roseibacillus sp.]|nr:ABC transporter permease [Roseibacillus sp.]
MTSATQDTESAERQRDNSLLHAERGSSLWRDAWVRMGKNKAAIVSLVVFIITCLLCFGFAWFCKDPIQQDLTNKFASPSGEHWLGTDAMGRDLFSRILYGGQVSILVGLVATFVAVTIGVTYGAISGFYGGRIDAIMMRTVDTLLSIPFLMVVIVLQAVLSEWAATTSKWIVDTWGWNKELTNRATTVLPLFFALGLFGGLTLARIVRAQVLSLKEREFVEAATSLGLSRLRVLFRHIIPNTLGPTVVYATLTVPGFIMYEATLSYLGLGVESPNSSWGILIKEGANYLETNPQPLILPGLFFTLTLFALNFLGDGLRDALDPKAAKD